MISPVQCNLCQQVYDLCDGAPVARYQDATVFITPCCERKVDDRPAGLTSSPAFRRLSRQEISQLAAKNGVLTRWDIHGRPVQTRVMTSTYATKART
jgi:hypothetical protein